MTQVELDYSDFYILERGTITVTVLAVGKVNNNIQVVFKNCAPFAGCTSKINNTQVDNAKGIDVLMPTYNLMEYIDNYSKTSGSLWKYYRDEPFLTDAGAADNFLGNRASFKLKKKLTGTVGTDGTKNV